MIYKFNMELTEVADEEKELVEEIKSILKNLEYKYNEQEDTYYIKVKEYSDIPKVMEIEEGEDIFFDVLNYYYYDQMDLANHFNLLNNGYITVGRVIKYIGETGGEEILDNIAEKCYEQYKNSDTNRCLEYLIANECMRFYMKKLYEEFTENIKSGEFDSDNLIEG